jgi:branched-chain amino acid transport system permease protein
VAVIALTSAGQLKRSYTADMAIVGTRGRRLGALLGIAVVLVIPAFASNFQLTILNLVAMASLGAMALNLLIGVAGQVSIGSAAFLAIGSFTAAFLGVQHDLPFMVAVPGAAVAAAIVGAVVGIPALRLRGLYLLIATLALHYIVLYLVKEYQTRETGPVGFIMPTPTFGGTQLSSPMSWYYVLIVFSALAAFAVVNLMRSRYGRAWMAIRDRDIAAEIIGLNVSAYKIGAFVVSALITGLQGGLYAYYLKVVDVEAFNFNLAVQYVAMIVIGGTGSVLGSYFGAGFVIGMPFAVTELVKRVPESAPGAQWLNKEIFEIQSALYGVAIVAFFLIEPAGLVALWGRFTTALRLWPFKREGVLGDG